MKSKLKITILLGIIFLSATTFGQAIKPASAAGSNKEKTAKTYLDLVVNVVNTSINYGSANNSLSGYKKSSNGIQAGVSFQAGITPSFSVVSELYFIRKGGVLKAGNPLNSYMTRLRLNTLELPLLARFHTGKFYVNAGPSVAFNFSGTRKEGNLSSKLSFGNSPGDFKHFDAGIQMGGGVEFPFKQKRIALDIRYLYGLTNIAHGQEMHNRAVMISVNFSKRWKKNPLGLKQR